MMGSSFQWDSSNYNGAMLKSSLFLRHRLPGYKIWLGALSRRMNETAALVLLSRVEAKYLELLARSPRYSPRVLQKLHLEKIILPAAAAYRILLMDGNS